MSPCPALEREDKVLTMFCKGDAEIFDGEEGGLPDIVWIMFDY